MPAEVDKRRTYWNQKHRAPHWAEDIHFGLIGDRQRLDLLGAVTNNTQLVCNELLDKGSVFWLSSCPRMLDFGCGKGDLLLEAARSLQHFSGVGIDISDIAIATATARDTGAQQVQFHAGGIEIIERLAKEASTPAARFDLITCRDAYYCLSELEQAHWWAAVRALLRPAGIVYVADLAAHESALARLGPCLLSRQFAGMPIIWDGSSGKRTFSIVRQAQQQGFELVGDPDLREHSVSKSYEAAIAMNSMPVHVADAYREVAGIASNRVAGSTAVPYVRFFFSLKPDPPITDDRHFGMTVAQDFHYDPKKPLMREGCFPFPLGTWSLMVGRSGVGKSTLFRLISGIEKSRRVHPFGLESLKTYFLRQHPDLLSEVSIETNVALFTPSDSDLTRLFADLGLDDRIRGRNPDDKISGGERQRAALCVAVASAPDVLLLDEPCAMVDRVRKYHFFSKLKRTLNQTPTSNHSSLLCVDHEFADIKGFFDHVFELSHGRLFQIS
jgi:ABC-type nitrate/sulfonate/bicarbonate transport system ATPase subunit/2-polyprenyl-3-methyl-5-hydroxy-6-metoxy-1,4-benzoquinol methylase